MSRKRMFIEKGQGIVEYILITALVTLAAVVVRIVHPFTPSGDRSMTKPLSLIDVSVHVRSIRDAEIALADKPLGAVGGTMISVVADATFDGSESPAGAATLPAARTR